MSDIVQIPPDAIALYQSGGSAYAFFEQHYGTGAANVIAEAAATGDRANLTDAISQVKFGNPLNDSTAEILADQLLNDPLGAPLDALDSGVNRIFASTGVKTVLVIVAAAGVVALIAYSTTRE